MTLPSTRAFDHVLIVMFENQYRGYVLQNPYMQRLARQGIDLTGFSGVMHPSQTNYIASIAGELCGVTGDDPASPLLAQRTVVDLLEEAPGGLSWKAYMESYVAQAQPWTPELAPADAPPYFVKHNPFGSFAAIVRNQARWQRVENEAALFADLLNGTFPSYAWFSPNTWSDGHWVDGTSDESDPRAPALVDQAARWLEGFFARLRFPGPGSHLPPRTLVVVAFDEADFEAEWEVNNASTYDGPNQVFAVLLGDMIEPGVEEGGYNHYSLLRTIEVNFGLGSLGKNDAEASWFQFLWGRHFHWGAPAETPIGPASALAAAGLGQALHVVYAAKGGELQTRTLALAGWSEERPVGAPADAVALAAAGEQLILVARDGDGGLSSRLYGATGGWSAEAEPVVPGPAGAFALASFQGGTTAMLVWRAADDTLHSRVWSAGRWAPPVAVAGFSGAGALTLCALGTSLDLIIEVPAAGRLDVVTYNTAPFNAVTVAGAPQNDTTVGAWSPSAFPVAHFSARPSAVTPGEPEPLVSSSYAARGPLAAAALDGVLHLVHPGIENPQLFTTTLSLAGLMTPLRPVATATTASADHSDGFGTLGEAGWGSSDAVPGAACAKGGGLAMATWDGGLALFFQPEPGGPWRLAPGRFEAAAADRPQHT
jgi:hypothetical protein